LASTEPSRPPEEDFSLKISSKLSTNLDNLSNMLDEPDDLKIRKLKLGRHNLECAIAYIEGITDTQSIREGVLRQLERIERVPHLPDKAFQLIYTHFIAIGDVEEGETFDELSLALLSGYTIFYINGINKVLMIETIGGEFRAIEE